MDTTGPFRKEIRLALLDAFRTPSELEMLVDEVLNARMAEISLANDMQTRAFELIKWAEARGRLTELLAGAAAERPRSEALKRLGERFEFAAPAAGEEERIVRPDVPFQNVAEWAQRFNQARTAVCRVEPQPLAEGDQGYGTGFLVAPDLVMTNFHVIDQPGWKAEKVRLRFDCETGADGKETPGRTFNLAGDWKVAASRRVEDGGCDYALLRLAEAPGESATAPGPRRVLRLSDRRVRQGQPVFVLQHPMASPMRLAIGTVTAPAFSAMQIGYNANTDGGSSGSPCFHASLQAVVALHHRGGLDNNLGVKAEAILGELADHPDEAVRRLAGAS